MWPEDPEDDGPDDDDRPGSGNAAILALALALILWGVVYFGGAGLGAWP